MAKPTRFRVVPQEEGMMLSHLLARRLPGKTVADGKALVKAGAVYVGHLRVRVPTVRVVAGERITVHAESIGEGELPLELVRIVHRDPDFVVLDKPAGVAVVATRESARGTLSEALRRVLEHEGVVRPYVGVVHRLDRGASGLVLFTVRSIANKSLHRQFVEHAIGRTYRVRVRGDAPADVVCDEALVEDRHGGMRVAAGHPHAKPARTRFARRTPALAIAGTSLLEAELETGRTHQIRVHAAALGLPVVGDRRYGGGAEGDDERLMLHAWRLDFVHPETDTRVHVVSELPDWARAEGE